MNPSQLPRINPAELIRREIESSLKEHCTADEQTRMKAESPWFSVHERIEKIARVNAYLDPDQMDQLRQLYITIKRISDWSSKW